MSNNMFEATAKGLDQAAAHYAFRVFDDKKFRRLATFHTFSQVDQNRIFNDLVVSRVVLIRLVLEAPDLRVPDEFRDYLSDIHGKLPKAHVDYLESIGVESKYLLDWETLISMRYDEYAKDWHAVRAAAMQFESAEKDLDVDDLSKIKSRARPCCCHYICRGKPMGTMSCSR